jgi:hypothetical protein
LVNRVVPPEELLKAALAIAEQFTTERQAEIDTAVKRMQADAAAAEKKLQKQMEQMGTQSWSALMAVLTETRAAFDSANQAARDALKRAA